MGYELQRAQVSQDRLLHLSHEVEEEQEKHCINHARPVVPSYLSFWIPQFEKWFKINDRSSIDSVNFVWGNKWRNLHFMQTVFYSLLGSSSVSQAHSHRDIKSCSICWNQFFPSLNSDDNLIGSAQSNRKLTGYIINNKKPCSSLVIWTKCRLQTSIPGFP